MALLEKKNLLYLLIFFSCFVSTSYAGDNQFFNSTVDYFSEPKQDCPSCKAQDEMNKNVADVISQIKLNAQLSSGGAGTIDLFLDSSCQFTQLAIKNLSLFNQNHPTMTVKVYVSGSTDAFLGIGRSITQEHPGWAVSNDLTGDNAKNSGVLKVPAYIFILQGKMYRIYGTPDLEATWSKINAVAK